MPMTEKQLFQEAVQLPDEAVTLLTEKLVEHLGTNISPELEQLHLDIVNRRRNEVIAGKVQPLDGQEVLARARQLVGI